jgi:hypothetical protein
MGFAGLFLVEFLRVIAELLHFLDLIVDVLDLEEIFECLTNDIGFPPTGWNSGRRRNGRGVRDSRAMRPLGGSSIPFIPSILLGVPVV